MPLIVFAAFLVMPAQAPTYHGDVAAVLEQRCTTCHQSGGVAPFALESYEDAESWSEQIADSVLAGRMPPWSPNERCRPLQRSRALPTAERDALVAWATGGAPIGDPATAIPVAPFLPPTLIEPIVTLAGSAAYLPSTGSPDDYRCVVLDHSFDDITYVTGYDFAPGQTELVHHAALFLALPAYFDQLEELEANQPDQVGYTCFGGPGIDFVEYFGGWVPGSGAVRFPDDAAFVIPAGAKVIMQVHYNMAAGFTAPDNTTVSLSTVDEAPTMRVKQRPQFNLDIAIDADDARSEQLKMTPHTGTSDWTGVGVLPHMHLLGEEVKLEIVHADGSRTCLVDIPAWDFDWQETYFFEDAVTVVPGDELELSCIYNNSTANQPVVDGVRGEPKDVAWGDGTTDEMCVVVLTTLVPMQQELGDTCVLPGDEGNDVGVGRFCTDIGGECDGTEADFCLASAVEDMPFCTKIFCGSDDECGEGATCEGGAGGSACIPLTCQGEGGDDGCGCDTASSSSQSSPGPAALALMLGVLALVGRRRSSALRKDAASSERE